jgi:uncharacterized Tic20 family protein
VAYIGLFGSFFGIGLFSYTTTGPYGPTTSDPFAFAPFVFLLVLYGVILVGSLINMIFSIIGAVNAFQGKLFHYPLLGWLQ